MKSAEYWQKRAEAVSDKVFKTADDLADLLQRKYQSVADIITGALEKLYARYGKEGNLQYSEVLKPLTPEEMRQFRREVQGWIERDTGLSDWSWIARLRQMYSLSSVTRLQSLLTQVQTEVEALGGTVQLATTQQVAGAYQTVYNQTLFEAQTGLAVATTFTKLDTKTLNRVIGRSWQGANFSQRVWVDTAKLVQQLNDLIPQTIVQGFGVDKAARQLRKRMEVSHEVAKRLIATETAHIASEATQEAYKESGVVSTYRFVATLDKRTSNICRTMDGKEFKMSEYQIGTTAPPLHVNCRSTTVAVFNDPSSLPETRIARDAEGKNIKVSGDTTYKEWASKLDVPEINVAEVQVPDDKAMPPAQERNAAAKAKELRARLDRIKNRL